ncbi:hypothetical protein FJ970_26075 [Mesorhizobium sp. B2-1-8]|uniref:hypothetical protein n=1 Tax=Mesorhizobium sp. B2-1-8 TaxID=2589967 RepID=UPI00112D3C4D|nr:hypothetical protein [Mesorhizobium sp. B2-1-8]UCI18494.1 hypothetical protein FJ970_26075 [Mesorhizobium sp. B2-1-8]
MLHHALARSRKAYSGWVAVSIVRQDRLPPKSRSRAQLTPAASPQRPLQAIFSLPFPGRRAFKQKFPGFATSMENSFPNGLLPGSSCIVLGRDDLLERPHETLCPEAKLEPGAKGSMI